MTPDTTPARVQEIRETLLEHANTHGADAPDGFNCWKYSEDGDHWRCSACGKQAKEGHADYCFKLTLREAADLIASLQVEHERLRAALRELAMMQGQIVPVLNDEYLPARLVHEIADRALASPETRKEPATPKA